MGMMSPQQSENPDLAHGSYNGVVLDPEGNAVEVQGGVAIVDGQPYFVSDSGAIVADAKGQLVGRIQNGKFVLVDDAYLNKMREAGYVK